MTRCTHVGDHSRSVSSRRVVLVNIPLSEDSLIRDRARSTQRETATRVQSTRSNFCKIRFVFSLSLPLSFSLSLSLSLSLIARYRLLEPVGRNEQACFYRVLSEGDSNEREPLWATRGFETGVGGGHPRTKLICPTFGERQDVLSRDGRE